MSEQEGPPSGGAAVSVTLLLEHLQSVGFLGAPRDHHPLTDGETGGRAGQARPAWVHSERALLDVAGWLRDYHRAVWSFVPSYGAVWRDGGRWRPGLIIGHRSATPDHAVWAGRRVSGFVGWEAAGPVAVEDDLADVVLAWVPLSSRARAGREGFHDFDSRRRRLTTFLEEYGWERQVDDVLHLVGDRLAARLDAGPDPDAEQALAELDDLFEADE